VLEPGGDFWPLAFVFIPKTIMAYKTAEAEMKIGFSGNLLCWDLLSWSLSLKMVSLTALYKQTLAHKWHRDFKWKIYFKISPGLFGFLVVDFLAVILALYYFFVLSPVKNKLYQLKSERYETEEPEFWRYLLMLPAWFWLKFSSCFHFSQLKAKPQNLNLRKRIKRRAISS